MAHKLPRDAYEDLIAENIDWLEKQPLTLERQHVIEIVRASADHEYSPFCGQCGKSRHDATRCDGTLLARP